MEFGYFLVTQFDESRDASGIADELVAQTRRADEAGFGGLHIGEHHATDTDQYLLNESALAHVAEHVGDMWLGASLCLLPYHNPVRIAELGATLDVLTDGAFRLGVGLGYRQKEYDVFGVTREDAPGRLTEGVEIVKRLWTQDTVTYEGEHYRFDEVSIRPQPVQDPRPLVWTGASNESSVRRGARLTDGFFGAHVPFDLAKAQVEAFRDERERSGNDPGEVGLLREAFVAETTEAAEAAVKDHLMQKYRSYIDWGQDDVIGGDSFDSPWEKLCRERFLVGTPETVVEGIERYRDELDLDHLAVRMQFPDIDFEDVHTSIELFGDAVIPHVE